ncbi:hypothetical protein GCK72_023628 [Caenorhabditis remanei]|uniref:Phorbol-ester/DAG-type domain-containing protein n=1 Tax=Caenorhabditis remanei TaxID=31234 RepID=A0A6A5FXC2_CAERE|nr:hypothetical protein GCK72_023628 [Caenorhabditis remanei]KAF1747167.1 hypothetical protein GCK72_023628 [Caenorhabditis remanei]
MELENYNRLPIAQPRISSVLNDPKKLTNYYEIKQARFQQEETKKCSAEANTLKKKLIEVCQNIQRKQEESKSGNITVHVFLAKYAVLEITKRIKKNAKNLKRENRKMKIEMEKLKKRNAKLSSKIDQLKKEIEKNKKEEEELKNAKESINQLSYKTKIYASNVNNLMEEVEAAKNAEQSKSKNGRENYQKMWKDYRCTRDITKLYPLPELPSLSNEFMNTYRNVMTKYSQEKNEYDVSKFCCFCHRQLKGLPVTCKYCKKSFHKKCVNKERGWCEAEMDTPKTSN